MASVIKIRQQVPTSRVKLKIQRLLFFSFKYQNLVLEFRQPANLHKSLLKAILTASFDFFRTDTTFSFNPFFLSLKPYENPPFTRSTSILDLVSTAVFHPPQGRSRLPSRSKLLCRKHAASKKIHWRQVSFSLVLSFSFFPLSHAPNLSLHFARQSHHPSQTFLFHPQTRLAAATSAYPSRETTYFTSSLQSPPSV